MLNRAAIEYASLIEHGQPVADVANEIEIVLDDNEGATLSVTDRSRVRCGDGTC